MIFCMIFGKKVDSRCFYAKNVEISRTIPKKFQNFVTVCSNLRHILTKTDGQYHFSGDTPSHRRNSCVLGISLADLADNNNLCQPDRHYGICIQQCHGSQGLCHLINGRAGPACENVLVARPQFCYAETGPTLTEGMGLLPAAFLGCQ